MVHTMTPEEKEREKRNAAFSSLLAALLLTALKFIVGISTNSLGILSEAAHSGFDLLAAGMTLFAVRYAAIPADPGHPYGHGKIENLSALVEALLLLITCGWIIWEAIDRLFFTPAVVQASIWALVVMVISIIVDISRSRMLRRIARKHKSQALEADALHFSTDILSSSVVILGLIALYIASFLPADSAIKPWLERADAIAALGVSAIIIHVSITLARQAINILLDAGDAQLEKKIIETVTQLAGIHSIQRLRLRHSGPSVFMDMAVTVQSLLTFEQVEQLHREIEALINQIDTHIDMTLEVLPAETDTENTITRVRNLAAVHGLDVHAIEFLDLEAKKGTNRQRLLHLHVERDATETLSVAHYVVSDFEARLREEFPTLTVVSYIEPKGRHLGQESLVHGEEAQHIRTLIHDVLKTEQTVRDSHNILIQSRGEGKGLSFHCRMLPETSVETAHETAMRIQAALHRKLPELKMVTVHMEPIHSSEEDH